MPVLPTNKETSTKLGELLREAMKAQHFEIERLHIESGLSRSALYNILNGDTSANIATLERICMALGVEFVIGIGEGVVEVVGFTKKEKREIEKGREARKQNKSRS